MRSSTHLLSGQRKFMASAEDSIRIEVVAATPERQELMALTLPRGSTAGDAVQQSGIATHFPGLETVKAELAIWGKVSDAATVLKSGDRVEILRSLEKDPREARREVASQGGFMSGGHRPPDA